ncbi:MotE family protein [Peribacillus asahii]|uniref:MotE family protein n=1 Tax=Peribacillus asahii TaxID=228899 RepID=UPI00380761F1
MARKAKQNIEDVELEEKKSGKIQWFLFAIVIPVIFAILVTIIVMTYYGVNVFEKTKEISDKISTQVFQNDEKQTEQTTADYDQKIVDLEAEIKDKEAEIQSLESIIDSRDKNLQKAEAEQEQLEKEINELKQAQMTSDVEIKEIVKTYEMMSAKKAAPIITQMSDDDAVGILANLKPVTLAKVLEQMAPEDAARLTKKLQSQS